MSPAALAAVRKEAFVQGWLRSYAAANKREIADYTDEELLALLTVADVAYISYRAERGK